MPPPTSNTLSSHERSALVRLSRKLYKVLGRVLDDDSPPIPSRPFTSSCLELNRTIAPGTDTPTFPVYHCPLTRRGSVLSVAPSIVSNAPSDAPSDITQRRTKLERLHRKLGDEPATAVPRTPRASTSSKKAPRARARSVVHRADDARSIAFSVNSDENVHTVTFSTRVHSSRPHKTKHVYQTGALPPVPPIPAHLLGDDDAGLIRPRQKMAAGSRIGGSDFKAAQRAKREGRVQNGMAEPGELMGMVGSMMF